MINPSLLLIPALQEIQAAQLKNSEALNSLTKATDELNLLTIQPWELPEEP